MEDFFRLDRNQPIVQGEERTVIESPVLVGHLNKRFGFHGLKDVEIGTEVFEEAGIYFFFMRTNDGETQVTKRFYKESLAPCIKFLNDD